MTTAHTVKVYMHDEDSPLIFNNATFAIDPDLSATITIDGETRAYFPPLRYHYITAE